MRASRVCRYTLREATASYARYFDYAGEQEMPALQQLFPHTTCDRHDVALFHAALCTAMRERGCEFAGIKVMPPTCEALHALRAPSPICVPLFSNMLSDGDDNDDGRYLRALQQERQVGTTTVSVRQHRLQYVEGCIVLRISDALPANATADAAALRCEGFCIGIELTGTRFAFYPPTPNALACDLGSCVRVVIGSSNSMKSMAIKPSSATPGNSVRKLISLHQFVLTHDDEPLQVGCGKNCLGDPLVAVATAAAYASEMQQPLKRGHVVVCAGASARSPAHTGKYVAQWGPYGSATCTLV